MPGDVARVLRDVERDTHVRLRAEVVDLVGLELVEQPHEARRVRQVGVVQEELDPLLVRVAVEVVDALGVERRRAADEAVDLVALVEQLLGEERAVLPGDAGDERAWHARQCYRRARACRGGRRRSSATGAPAPDRRLHGADGRPALRHHHRRSSRCASEIDAAIADVVAARRFILGPEVAAFEQEFAAYCGTRHAVGVANGTDALTIALRAMGVGPGDEVIVPSFTFYATAEAIPPTGARPVFCDVDPDTFCITAETVAAALTPATKAVVAVHLFGNLAPVAEIEALGVPVLEDAAQAAGTRCATGRPGALGSAATFSFFPSKNLGCFGDGGAITTDDDALAERRADAALPRLARQGHLRARRLQLAPRRAAGGDPARAAAALDALGGRAPRRRAPLRGGGARRARDAAGRRRPAASRRGTSTSCAPSAPTSSPPGCASAGSAARRTTARRSTASRRWRGTPAASSCRSPTSSRARTWRCR